MPRSTRPALLAAYLYVAGNWAVTVDDLPGDRETNQKLLAKLRRDGLLHGEHVNGEKALTYQSDFDCENDNRDDWKELATAKFNERYPEPVEQAPASKGGATGPRYSEGQIAKGIALRASGLGWEAVAKEVGVKAASYFSRVVKAANGGDPKGEAAPAKAKKAPAKKGTGINAGVPAARRARSAAAKKGAATRAAKKAAREATPAVPQDLVNMLTLPRR